MLSHTGDGLGDGVYLFVSFTVNQHESMAAFAAVHGFALASL